MSKLDSATGNRPINQNRRAWCETENRLLIAGSRLFLTHRFGDASPKYRIPTLGPFLGSWQKGLRFLLDRFPRRAPCGSGNSPSFPHWGTPTSFSLQRARSKRMFAIEDETQALRKKFYPRFEKALGAKRAAKFYQVDNRLSMILNVQLTSEIPLIP